MHICKPDYNSFFIGQIHSCDSGHFLSPLALALFVPWIIADNPDDSAAADDFLRGTPVSFPILYDRDNQVSKLYDIIAMPSTVIVGRDGKVRYIHHGYEPGDENGYQDQIRMLVRE